MLNKVLDFLFPPVCGLCEKSDKEWICNECLKKLEINLKKINKKDVYYLTRYKDDIRKMLINFKFNDKAYLYKTFSSIILKNKKLCKILNSYDIIIPVPMFFKKKNLRGYNQTELIAKEVSKKTNIEFFNNCLIKIRDNNIQSTLSYFERKNNIKNVFNVSEDCKDKILNKKVILFDDIYTTGFTVEECIKELKKYNPEKITVVVLAKGKIERR